MRKRGSVGDTGWTLWRWFDIMDPAGKLYLRRLYIIATPWFSVMLHWILAPDPDRDPHDHPWSFISIVLRGGYQQKVYRGRNVYYFQARQRWSWRYMHAEGVHQINYVYPKTITLILTGPRRREWGFLTTDGWVHFKSYLKRHVPERAAGGLP